VTVGLNKFLQNMNQSWMIWQTFPNGSFLIAILTGSKATVVQFYPHNGSLTYEPQNSYPLGEDLSLINYTVSGNIVNSTCSVKALLPGNYPTQSNAFDWMNFTVVPLQVGITSQTNPEYHRLSPSCSGTNMGG